MNAGDPGVVSTWVALNSGPWLREGESPMGNNTQTPSNSPLPPPSPLPKFEWPARGQDCPRLTWPTYVKLLADELDQELGGETGHYLGNWLTALFNPGRAAVGYVTGRAGSLEPS